MLRCDCVLLVVGWIQGCIHLVLYIGTGGREVTLVVVTQHGGFLPLWKREKLEKLSQLFGFIKNEKK